MRIGIAFFFLSVALPAAAQEHRFYDRPGKILFTAAGVAAAFDTAQACHNLATGGRELGLPTQHCPQVSLILMGQVAVQEIAAYGLHKLGFHKLERFARFFTMEENTRALIYSKRHGSF
jgi:hypothetical protein